MNVTRVMYYCTYCIIVIHKLCLFLQQLQVWTATNHTAHLLASPL